MAPTRNWETTITVRFTAEDTQDAIEPVMDNIVSGIQRVDGVTEVIADQSIDETS